MCTSTDPFDSAALGPASVPEASGIIETLSPRGVATGGTVGLEDAKPSGMAISLSGFVGLTWRARAK
jgi:hypothetical protein